MAITNTTDKKNFKKPYTFNKEKDKKPYASRERENKKTTNNYTKPNFYDKDREDEKQYRTHSKKSYPTYVRNVNKPKIYDAITPPADLGGKAGLIEYKMAPGIYNMLVTEWKKKNNRGKLQEFLCEYVNTQCGLIGYCVRVYA